MAQKHKITKQSVLLFTGGAKGITAQCALELAKSLPCTYVLMGRSQRLPEPQWAQGILDPGALKAAIVEQLKQKGEKPLPGLIEHEYRAIISAREVEETLAEFESLNAPAYYLSADVTDAVQVQGEIQQFEKEYGRTITGLVHGAGRLADKRIERKSIADFEAVYGTKVGGFWNVLNALDRDHLELLVLFSSVAGTFGNIGQADYAMANEVLNKTAYQFQQAQPACQVLSINWGPWDSGMVSEELKKAFSAMGIVLISIEEGAKQFVDVVYHRPPDFPQLVIGSAIQRPAPTDRTKSNNPIRVRRVIEPARNPFLYDHQIGENRVLPATCAAAWMADTCEALFPGYRFFRLENYRVFKGLVFADDSAIAYTVEVSLQDSEVEQEIHCQVRVLSEAERPLLHYQAGIVLKAHSAFPAPPHGDFVVPAPINETTSAAHFYAEKILFHGPVFQGLKSMALAGDHSLSCVSQLANIDAHTQGQFTVRASNPYMNDVILQGLLVWTYWMDQAVCLPSGIHKMEQYRLLPFDRDCYVQAKVTSHTATSIRADAEVYDAQGNLYLRFEGVEGTISKMLLPLFQSSRTSLDRPELKNTAAERIAAGIRSVP